MKSNRKKKRNLLHRSFIGSKSKVIRCECPTRISETTMINCSRCCLQRSMRTVNLVVNFCGAAMIIYSLWLLKRWRLVELDSASALFRPWFIYTCLGEGIVVCLSMISGHMVTNCLSNSTLSIYLVSVCSILCVQIGVIVSILFKMDWKDKISKYIYVQDEEFANFLTFHLSLCRLFTIMIIVAQIIAAMFAIILWAVGPEPRSHCHNLNLPEIGQSFLEGPDLPVNHNG